MKVELLDKADYLNIMILWEKSVKATHSFLKEKDFALIKKCFPTTLLKMKLFGIKESSELLGFMGVSEYEIEALFVNPEYFGKGVGKYLVLYAIKELNLKKVSVNEQNQKAFDFYKRFGFKPVSRNEYDFLNLPYPILHLAL